jgi:hypothetical protein
LTSKTKKGQKAPYYNLGPTPVCKLCKIGTHTDFFYLHTCPALKETQDKIKERIDNSIKTITPDKLYPFYWCPEIAATFKTTPPTHMTRQKKCICTLLEHGTYVKYKTCNNKFHPDCIGIKVMKEKLLKIEEQLKCREWNPNNPYLFSK